MKYQLLRAFLKSLPSPIKVYIALNYSDVLVEFVLSVSWLALQKTTVRGNILGNKQKPQFRLLAAQLSGNKVTYLIIKRRSGKQEKSRVSYVILSNYHIYCFKLIPIVGSIIDLIQSRTVKRNAEIWISLVLCSNI